MAEDKCVGAEPKGEKIPEAVVPNIIINMEGRNQLSDDIDEINIWEIVDKLIRNRKTIAWFTLAGFLLSLLFPLVISIKGPLTGRIMFSYADYKKGVFPDGTSFNADNLRSPDIIQQAIQDMKLVQKGVNVDLVRGYLKVSAYIPEKIFKAQQAAKDKGQPLEPFNSGEYNLTLDLPKNLGLSDSEQERLLKEIMLNYIEKFSNDYIAPSSLANIPLDIQNYDYFEIDLVLNKEIRSLISYLAEKEQKAGDFHSITTGQTFGDIRKRAEILWDVDFNTMASLINTYNLSKDPAKLMDKMDYLILKLGEREQKSYEKDKVVNETLNQAKDRKQSYLFVSGSNQDEQNLQIDKDLVSSLVQNDIFNILIKQSLDAGIEAKDITVEKQQVIQTRDRYKAISEQGTGFTEQQIAEVRKVVDNDIPEVVKKYQLLVDNTIKTNSDFSYQELGGSVKITGEPSIVMDMNKMMLFAVLGIVLGFMFSMLFLLVRDSWRNYKTSTMEQTGASNS